jgi:hypothetical protein
LNNIGDFLIVHLPAAIASILTGIVYEISAEHLLMMPAVGTDNNQQPIKVPKPPTIDDSIDVTQETSTTNDPMDVTQKPTAITGSTDITQKPRRTGGSTDSTKEHLLSRREQKRRGLLRGFEQDITGKTIKELDA